MVFYFVAVLALPRMLGLPLHLLSGILLMKNSVNLRMSLGTVAGFPSSSSADVSFCIKHQQP